MRRICVLMMVLLIVMQLTGCFSSAAPEPLQYETDEGRKAKIGEWVMIDGVDVSSMTREEAIEALSTEHMQRLERIAFSVKSGVGDFSIDGGELPVSFNDDDIIAEAMMLTSFWPKNNGYRELHTDMILDEAAFRKLIEARATLYYRDPVDARWKFDPDTGTFAYTSDENGAYIDAPALADALCSIGLSEGNHSVDAMLIETQADYSEKQAVEDTQLISEFTTSFSGSTYGKKNRVFNIVKSAGLINGKIVEPGGVFDINAILGPRNEENGWATATGIRDGEYVQEYGGGVCQVSTTLYNAVMLADLDVTERQHHSWPLGYVDIGRDATISTGGPNLVFVNSTDASIIVHAVTDEREKTVTVRIFGRKRTDGVYITLTSKKVETLPSPGYETALDASLPAGSRVVDREARRGSVAVTYKEYRDNSGNVIDTVEYTRDKYRSIKGLVYVSKDIYYGWDMSEQPPVEQ